MRETRKKIAGLKESNRETYDQVLEKLLALIPNEDDEGIFSDSFKAGMLNAKVEIRTGKTISHKKLKEQLGL